MQRESENNNVIPGAEGNRESNRYSFCRHPEFISGSSRFNSKDKMLKQVQHDDVGVRAFTLIELLVVVLIIGILAAAAIPQYEKAVLKTRMSGILPLMKTIKDAEERYYLANNKYTDDLTELDIVVPAGDVNGNPAGGYACYKNGTCFDSITNVNNPNEWLIAGGIGSNSQGTVENDSCFFTIYFDHSTKPGVIECGKLRSTHSKCAALCKSMGYE